MFWIAREMSNPMVGLIARLSLPVRKLTASIDDGVPKSSNTASIKKIAHRIKTVNLDSRIAGKNVRS